MPKGCIALISIDGPPRFQEGVPLHNSMPHPEHTRAATSSMPPMCVLWICLNAAEAQKLRQTLVLQAGLLHTLVLQMTVLIIMTAGHSSFAELFEVIQWLHCIVV